MNRYGNDWKELSNAIKNLDGCCAICKTRNGPFNAHHIDGIVGHRDPANLITLCERCHMRRVHGHGRRGTLGRMRGLLLILASRRAMKNRTIRRMNRRKPR